MPDPAAASGLLAMADGVSIALEHTKRSDTQRALSALDRRRTGRCSHLLEGERQVYVHR